MLKYLRNLLKLRRQAEKKSDAKQLKHEQFKADAALIEALMFPASANGLNNRTKKQSTMPKAHGLANNSAPPTFTFERVETKNPMNKRDGCCHSWTSFESLLADKYGVNAFRLFLQSEFSEENLAFWVVCEHFKQIKSRSKLNRRARKIFKEYIEEGSPKQVNIDSGARSAIKGKLTNPTPDMFNQVQQRLQYLMENDSYRRFQNSDFCKQTCAMTHPCSRPN